MSIKLWMTHFSPMSWQNKTWRSWRKELDRFGSQISEDHLQHLIVKTVLNNMNRIRPLYINLQFNFKRYTTFYIFSFFEFLSCIYRLMWHQLSLYINLVMYVVISWSRWIVYLIYSSPSFFVIALFCNWLVVLNYFSSLFSPNIKESY